MMDPEWLHKLYETIEHGLPVNTKESFTSGFQAASLPCVNLESVHWLLAVQRHKRQLERIATNPEPYARQVEVGLNLTILCCQLNLGKVEWESSSLIITTRAAALLSAMSASQAVMWKASTNQEKSLARTARAAAYSAASIQFPSEASAWSAAWAGEPYTQSWRAQYQWEADTLLRLLRETS